MGVFSNQQRSAVRGWLPPDGQRRSSSSLARDLNSGNPERNERTLLTAARLTREPLTSFIDAVL